MNNIFESFIDYYLNETQEDEIQQYIDIISMNPKAYEKYIKILKDKYGVDYHALDSDADYIKNASMNDIKTKDDFLNFDNYIKYAKEIFKDRDLLKRQPNHLEGVVTLDDANEVGKKLGFKVKFREYTGYGNFAAYDLVDTMYMPLEMDVNTFIHEVGHHYDHNTSKGYNGLAKTITYASSPYEIGKNNEVFAENFLHFFIAPKFLKKYLPEVYDELNKKINNKTKQIIKNILDRR